MTAHPTAEWIASQLTEAYGWQQAPHYMVRDRDGVYGHAVLSRLRAMGIRDRPIAARSPWQNGCAERLIGSIRRDCLDHVVVFGERHLRHLLKAYQKYYNEARTHLSLEKDAPIPRAVQAVGQTMALPPAPLLFKLCLSRKPLTRSEQEFQLATLECDLVRVRDSGGLRMGSPAHFREGPTMNTG